jgi:hypothetical protein
MIDALSDPANWLAFGKPDAILFSGGGNDIAGDQFCIYLDYASEGGSGLNPTRLSSSPRRGRGFLPGSLWLWEEYAPNIPIFAHCYDFGIPNGTHSAMRRAVAQTFA